MSLLSKNMGGFYECFFHTSPDCTIEYRKRSDLLQVVQRGNKVLICKHCLWEKIKQGIFVVRRP